MKKALLAVIFFLSIQQAFACLSASQNRLFPLGQTSNGLLVVETHLRRGEYYDKNDKSDKMSPVWAGISFFKIYDENYKEVYSEILDTLQQFQQKHYDSIISQTVDKGLRTAKKYKDFVPAQPLSISFCDYLATCSKASLVFDTIQNKISVELPNKTQYNLKPIWDSTSIAANLIDYYSGFDDGEISARMLKDNLGINSVRQFLIGNKKLTVVHLGMGHQYTNADGIVVPGTEYPAPFEFTALHKSVFTEPVLHHGNGFDFYIWE